MLDPEDRFLLRYSRHILLDEFGIEGQDKLLHSSVLLIGAGGLGSSAAMYLAAAGVGQMMLMDDDQVDLTNLQRQIAHSTARIGQAKVESAAHTLKALNPEVAVIPLVCRADMDTLPELVSTADVVLDCSDNFKTRYAINRVCVANQKPLVLGAAVQFKGQVTVFDPRILGAPCYHCLFEETNGPHHEAPCATFGVFSPLAGIIGSQQAAEAIKILVGIGSSLLGRLQILDALTMRWREIKYHRDPACPVCAD